MHQWVNVSRNFGIGLVSSYKKEGDFILKLWKMNFEPIFVKMLLKNAGFCDILYKRESKAFLAFFVLCAMIKKKGGLSYEND